MSDKSETAANTGAEHQVSAAPHQAVEKRSLQMKQFRDKDALKRCIETQTAIPLGQIVGHAFDVIMKEGQLPDGTRSVSPFIVGDFEAAIYKTGEVLTASGAYLPRYFAETLQAALKKGQGATHGISFGVEILVEPTGKDIGEGIPYAYAVKRLIARRPDSPIEQMKRELAAAGTLRLPAPRPAPAAALEMDELPEPAGNVEDAGAQAVALDHAERAADDTHAETKPGKAKPGKH